MAIATTKMHALCMSSLSALWLGRHCRKLFVVCRMVATVVRCRSAAPRLLRQQFRAVLEMHRIEMIPVAAPDKSVLFEQPHDLNRDAVFPHRRLRVGRPAPVVRGFGADI